MDLAERRQQLGVLGGAAQRVDQHRLGRAGAVVLHQEAGVAQRFRRRPVRGLDGAGELLAGELARALALVGERHHRQRLGVARRLGQRGAHVLHRRLRAVGVERELGAQLQRRDVVAVRGQHRLDDRRGRVAVAGLGQHAGEAGLEVAGGVRGLGVGDEPAHRRDRRVGVAGGEVERGAGPGVGRGVVGRGDQPVELGAGGRRSADLVQEAHQRQRRPRIGRSIGRGVGRRRQRRAQHRLGGVGVVALEVPLHQRRAHRGVLREERGHPRQLGPGAGRVAEHVERGEAGEVQPLVAGGVDEGRVDLRQRLGRRVGGQPVGDQHHPRRHRAGDLGDHRRRHRHRCLARLAALAEVDGGLQRPHPGVGGGEGVGLDGGERRGVEVAGLERELGQRPLAGDVLRVLLDQAHQLVQRLAGLAAVAQQPGEGEPRRGMAVVEPEDVAELEPRPRLVAFGQQRQRPLVVRLGPLGRGVAGGQRQQGGQQQARPGGAEEKTSPRRGGTRTSPRGAGRTAAPRAGNGRASDTPRGGGRGASAGARQHRASRSGPEAAIA